MSDELDLAPTGIDGLDDILGGGLPRGRTYLVTGETGTCKTIFSLTFLIGGAIKHGEPGIYVSVDEDYSQFVKGAYAFGWDIEYLRSEGLLEVLTPETELIEKIREKDPTAVARSIVMSIAEYVKWLKATRLVIDPIAPLVTLEKDVQVLREYIRTLVLEIEKKIGATTIITTEIPSGSNALSRYGVEEFLASGVFVLGIARTSTGDFRRFLFIRKMRWRPVEPGIYEIGVERWRGVYIKGRLRNVHVPYISTVMF